MNKTSQLNAVNTMLSVIGESPVATIDGNQSVDAHISLNILEESLRAVMLEAWEFNTEEVTLTPDTTGRIFLPASYLLIFSAQADSHFEKRYTERQGHLYDLKASGDGFIHDGPVTLTAVQGFDFEDCPEFVRQYAMIRSARVLQDRRVMDASLHTFSLQDELMARARAIEADHLDGEYHMLEHPAQASIVLRRGRPHHPNG